MVGECGAPPSGLGLQTPLSCLRVHVVHEYEFLPLNDLPSDSHALAISLVALLVVYHYVLCQ